MASVFKKAGVKKGYWYACFTNDQGRRVHRSTKRTNRTEALAVALAWDQAARAGRERTLTEVQARKVIAEMVERSTGTKMQFHSCRAWLREWLEMKRGTVEGSTMLIYERVVNTFIESLARRADLSITTVSVADIRNFRDRLLGGKISPGAVNHQIKAILSGPFARAKTLGLILVNPCAGLDSLQSGPSMKRQPFNVGQIADLLRHADDDWRGMIILGYYTGLRLRDCAQLRWNQIDPEGQSITITPQKTKARDTQIVIPMHEELLKWLKTRARGIGKVPLFPKLVDLETKGYNGLSAQFARIMVKARVRGTIKQGPGRKTSSLSFHSLRHSFVSALANAGIGPEIRQKISGHSDDQSHARYTHHEMETLRSAVEKMPRVGTSR